MEHLIANSSIQFIVTEIETNPDEPFNLSNGKPLKYTFLETIDFLNDAQISFDVCYYHSSESVYIPISYLKKTEQLSTLPNGRADLDETGVGKVISNISISTMETYPNGDACLTNINSLNSYRVKNVQTRSLNSAFELLLNTWLPVPMFEQEEDGISSSYPLGWCRVKITQTGQGQKKGLLKYRLIWAFDTQLASDSINAIIRPYFFEGEKDYKIYSLCNRVDNMYDLLKISGESNETAVSDYLASKLGLNLDQTETNKYKFLGFYIYLINFLRLSGAAPQITLHNKVNKEIDVDLVLDIGNSRTCGVLFENGNFTKARMINMRDLSEPWRTYDSAFDMRMVFRKADFGNDLTMDESLFNWHSIVRVGEEAKHLIYKSLDDDGISERTTNYSSPKRYLWDYATFSGKWEFLTIETDPFNVLLNPQIYVKGLTDRFTDDGNIKQTSTLGGLGGLESDKTCHYSRASLMRFVMLEILQQTICDINSASFRKYGNIDCPRRIRNVIITCPTAMPIEEQITLRQSAIDAFHILKGLNPSLTNINVTPSPETIKISEDTEIENQGWSYDEAFASQLVYLFAEINQRYDGENHKFIETKGHIRPEHKAEGYNRKSVTIGSIDIGAGTTDIMICSYQYEGEYQSRLTPIPLFWDSYYLAGDDVLQKIILKQIIDGKKHDSPDMGSIHSALIYRMLKMTNEELIQHTSLDLHPEYPHKMDKIQHSFTPQDREQYIREYASNLVHDYFGEDSAMMTFRDRQYRNEFNTQISLPIAQFMMNLLAKKRPSKVYMYDEIFLEDRPSCALLDHFAHHFGFRFEELSWRFNPEEISAQVRSVLEPLMKQLSIVLNAHNCDILVLSGRPTGLEAITDLFVKYYPLSPDRLIRLNQYNVGNWYPLADGQGFFYDQKSVVAVGAMVGFLATTIGFHGLELDFSQLIKKMKSTAKYLGLYKPKSQKIEKSILTPEISTATIEQTTFPAYIGCKQFNAPIYESRPLFVLLKHTDRAASLRIILQRNYTINRESLEVVDVSDSQGNSLPLAAVELRQQSLAKESHWLDNGAFELSKEKMV